MSDRADDLEASLGYPVEPVSTDQIWDKLFEIDGMIQEVRTEVRTVGVAVVLLAIALYFKII